MATDRKDKDSTCSKKPNILRKQFSMRLTFSSKTVDSSWAMDPRSDFGKTSGVKKHLYLILSPLFIAKLARKEPKLPRNG